MILSLVSFMTSSHPKRSLVFCLVVFVGIRGGDGSQNERLILISVDGLRYDYIDRIREQVPALNIILANAASVAHVRNVFPTDTLPNHYSLITGLYPEHHGIVANQMFDLSTNASFNLRSSDRFWWNWAEPLWITNKRHGSKSGLVYYPGYDVQYDGIQADYNVLKMNYDKPFASPKQSMPIKMRMDIVLRWLSDDPSLTFVAIYINSVDATAHRESPDSDDVRAYLKRLEAFKTVGETLVYFADRLRQLQIDQNVNIIVTGDHGHVNTNHVNMIKLSTFLDVRKYVAHAYGRTSVFLYPKPGALNFVYNSLKGKHQNMTVFLKEDIPESFHIKHCNRTAPLLLLSDPGWLIDPGLATIEYLQGKFERGEHGYSNDVLEMNPGFLAWGPSFLQGSRQTSIEIVDIYSAMCSILNLQAPANDGNYTRVKPLLVPSSSFS